MATLHRSVFQRMCLSNTHSFKYYTKYKEFSDEVCFKCILKCFHTNLNFIDNSEITVKDAYGTTKEIVEKCTQVRTPDICQRVYIFSSCVFSSIGGHISRNDKKI